jgi:hypothetical protein
MSLHQVKYVGLSDVRLMSQKDLSDAGVGVDGQLKWDRRNAFTLYVENPSDRLLEIFKLEGTFTVQEVDADSGDLVGQPVVKGRALEREANTVRDGNTGQTSTVGDKDKSKS